MKKLIYISIIALLWGASACSDFLEEEPMSFASPENFYETEGHAEAAVIGAYSALQRNGIYGSLQYFTTTDLIRTAGWNTQGGIGTYTMSAGNNQVILPIWRDHYQGINEANAAITHIPGITMDEDHKNRLVGEARFLRALMYFNLVRYFGDVPYRGSETNSLNDLYADRTPAATIYERIIEDLEFGIANMGEKGEVEPGRATAGAAKTLLSKVYLTRGSMAKRDGQGDATADFQKAAQYAKEVIDGGQYRLEDYFPDAFIVENKNNDEIIFDVQFMAGGLNEGNFIGMHMGLMGPPPHGGSWGNIHSTQYYHTIFEETDMVRQEWSSAHVRVLGPGNLKTDYEEMHWQPWKIGKFRRFPVRNANYNFRDHDIHWPVFRYAEVLLIYAEAMNEVSGPTAEVFDALNQLRARARNVNGDGTREYLHADILPRELTNNPDILPDISTADYPDFTSVNEYIQYERARELGGEGKRWFDLVRWGNLVERIKFVATHVPEGRTRAEDNWGATANNVSDHHLLMPIPFQEVEANPQANQNPGY